MSRTPRQIQAEMFQVQAPGWVFPDDPDTYWGARLFSWASEASLIEASMEALLPEIDIRSATNLLPDYQRVLGPDPCNRNIAALDFNDQAAIAFQRWTAGGDMCAGALVAIAEGLGTTATVQESVQCICGPATCDSEMVEQGQNFIIAVSLPASGANLAQCPIEHAMPLHTTAAFILTGS